MVVRAGAAAGRVAPRLDPDALLVEAARRRPHEFLALYDRYFERVLGYVRLQIRDAATCEDVTSHVFTTALARLAQFRGEGTFAGWLFQITRNAVRDAQRRPLLEELAEELPATTPGLDERVIEEERAVRLRRLVGSLEPDQRHLLALRYGAGLSCEQIGVIVGASAGAVRVRLHRLLHELRERYPHDA